MIWLGIDTANTPLSVAIVKDGEVITEENTSTKVNHSLRAMPAIEEAFQRAKMTPDQIDFIAVSEGPGSYTGVRIGVTVAKTLAWTLNKPLIGVSSLQSLAMNACLYDGFICPLFDARRNHVYTALYHIEKGQLDAHIDDQHMSIEALIEVVKELNRPVLFIGKDVAMYRMFITEQLGDLAQFVPYPLNIPRASSLIYAAERLEAPVDVHHFVPKYRRIAEAEANWLKTQGKDRQDG